jgi:hypothetical protein
MQSANARHYNLMLDPDGPKLTCQAYQHGQNELPVGATGTFHLESMDGHSHPVFGVRSRSSNG